MPTTYGDLVSHVTAKLPEGWQRDEMHAEDVYDRIARYLARGVTVTETARHVGVSDKTVTRFARNGRPHSTFVECMNCGNTMRPLGTKWAHVGGREAAGCRVPAPPL